MNPFISAIAGSALIPGLEFFLNNATLSDRAIINAPKQSRQVKSAIPKGTKAIRSGSPVFWTGPEYGYQTGATAVRTGLLGSEIVGNEAFAKAPATSLSIPQTSSAPVTTTVTPPAERSYQQEKARASQLSEQDPLFKKYRVADLTKAYNTAATPEEKQRIGLEIWATTNPQLAQKLKPGQLGYQEATSAFMSQSPLGQVQASTGDMQYVNKLTQPFNQATINPFTQQELQMPLTGIEIPALEQVGTSEKFAEMIPSGSQLSSPKSFLNPADISEVQKALLKQAFASRLK